MSLRQSLLLAGDGSNEATILITGTFQKDL